MAISELDHIIECLKSVQRKMDTTQVPVGGKHFSQAHFRIDQAIKEIETIKEKNLALV